MKDCTYSNEEHKPEPAQTLAYLEIPKDLEIPTLSAVLDPIRLRKKLGFLSSPPWQWGELSDVRVHVLRCHSGRCTFEIAVGTTTGVRRLIGKVYALDGSGVFQSMERISRAGFGQEAEFSIPQPVAFMPKLHFLLQEYVPGRLAKEVFLTGTEGDCAAAAERCARWLARLHTLAPKGGPVFDLNNYLMFVERWSRSIADSGDALSSKVGRLFGCLERAARHCPALSHALVTAILARFKSSCLTAALRLAIGTVPA